MTHKLTDIQPSENGTHSPNKSYHGWLIEYTTHYSSKYLRKFVL